MVDEPEKVGAVAMLMTRLCHRVGSSLNTYDADGGWNNCLVLLLNQVREDLKIRYGNPEIAPGGHALRHAASIIIRLNRGEWIEETLPGGEKVKIGHAIRFRTEKNKTFSPFRESQFDFHFAGPLKGQIDTVEEILRYGQLRGVVTVEGRTFRYGDVKTVGRDNFLGILRQDGRLAERIRHEVLRVSIHRQGGETQ